MGKVAFYKSVAFRTIVLVIVVLAVEGFFVSGFYNLNLDNFIEDSSNKYRKDITEQEKEKVKDSVNLAYSVVKSFYDASNDMEALKANEVKKLRQIVDTVVSQAEGIRTFSSGNGTTQSITGQIINLVKDARYAGSNYLWIQDMDSRMIFHPIKPALNGKDLSNLKDSQGTYLIKEMSRLAKSSGSGTVAYLWTKPGEETPKLKISYIRRVKGTDLAIGTGSWVEDITQKMKEEALKQISEMRLGSEKYFWINDFGPKMVMHPIKPALNGKDISGIKDKKGKNLFVEMTDKAKNDGEGFVTYWWDKPGSDVEAKKLSYVKAFKPWGWIIGMGIYIDNIERAVTAQKTEFTNTIGTIESESELFTLGLIIIAAILYTFLLRSGLNKPLDSLVEFSSRIAAGELEHNTNQKFSGEMAVLNHSMETMVDSLKEKIKEAEELSEKSREETKIAEQFRIEAEEAKNVAEEARTEGLLQAADMLEGLVNDMSSASEELSAQVEEVTRGTDIQQQRISETAAAMEEMNNTVLEVARSASDAAHSADQANENAREGSSIVDTSVEAIISVKDHSETLKSNMDELEKQAHEIGDIMDVITDIADQTNLLALNAAIEAARAGDAGRGFAVVADEVRKLAEKTMQATQEVGKAITNIQEGAKKNQLSVDNSAKAVDEATDLAHESKKALGTIMELINLTSDQVSSIATAAEQQSSTSEEITSAVEDIKVVSADTADGMEQANQAIAELARLASDLKMLTENLRSDN
ncbi:methyl-accepting chemotaxis protein [Maridesulfovibrio bastinii]|uniref:methyl-accepting chemotaxis protein n=1 Tax=Maridesulfovibrio bastinii TaxID=47157 RepID=UPI00041CABD7|nr:cache domain-containing protein [Maridesulfovibrio bastinii]